MNYDKLYILIEKYFNGESSVKEEAELKTFFQNTTEVPEELVPIKNQFAALNALSSEKLDESFDNKILEAIAEKPSHLAVNSTNRTTRLIKHPLSFGLSAVAASLLLLFTIWTTTNIFNSKATDTKSSNLTLNYQQATDALSLLAINFDHGLNQTRQAAKPLNKGIDMLSNIGEVNKSIETLEPLRNLSNMEIIKNNK